MHLLPLTILALLGLFSNFSDNNTPLKKEYYADGSIKTEYVIKNSKMIEAAYYYQNGSIREKGTFKGQLMHGLWQSYNTTGNLVAEAKYNNGKVEKRVFYNTDGTVAHVVNINQSDEIVQLCK